VGIDNHDVTLELDIVPKALLYEEEFKGRLIKPYGGFYLTWCLINEKLNWGPDELLFKHKFGNYPSRPV